MLASSSLACWTIHKMAKKEFSRLESCLAGLLPCHVNVEQPKYESCKGDGTVHGFHDEYGMPLTVIITDFA